MRATASRRQSSMAYLSGSWICSSCSLMSWLNELRARVQIVERCGAADGRLERFRTAGRGLEKGLDDAERKIGGVAHGPGLDHATACQLIGRGIARADGNGFDAVQKADAILPE